jgi:hypothetical protein
MATGWHGESKRHSIAKKYGRVGSKKIEACKLSSISSKERYERFKHGEDLTREELEEVLRSDTSLDEESREAIRRHLFATRRPRLGEETIEVEEKFRDAAFSKKFWKGRSIKDLKDISNDAKMGFDIQTSALKELIRRRAKKIKSGKRASGIDFSKAADKVLECVYFDEDVCPIAKKKVAKELKKRGLNTIGAAHYTKNYERRRVFNPERCKAKSFRTQRFGSTKSARVACQLKKSGKWATQSVLIYRGEPKARKQKFRKMATKLIKKSRRM